MDLSEKLENNCKLEIVNFDSEEGKEVYWHSTSHLMASAVKMLFPNAKLAIGPAIKEGFYYDFDVDEPFTPEDLERIEEKMHRIVEANDPFFRSEISKSEAVQLFTELDENINWKYWKA